MANLEYLLMWFRDCALNLILRHYLDLIEYTLERYQQFWLHKKGALGNWFNEWPNGQRPLSTTWPWNVKPSLLVLWGVCWMFFDHEGRNFGPPENFGQDFWTRQATTQSQPSTQPLQQTFTESSLAPAVPATYQNYAWGNPYQAGAQVRRANEGIPANTPSAAPTSASPYSYISVSSDESSDLFPSPAPEGWPYLSGISPATVPAFQPTNFWSSPGTFAAPNLTAIQNIEQPISLQPYALPQARTTQAGRGGTPNRLGFGGLGSQRRNMQDYPSPQLSDVSGQADPSYAAFQPQIMATPDTGLMKSPSLSRTGEYFCNHPSCALKPPRFSRKCEWSKHMDKHTRPYVCEEPGCENLRGFTYSGGLHRHQREVHRQHGGPRAACFCPHKDCKRSTGVGFSRKENLAEHLRRVHRDGGDEGDRESTPALERVDSQPLDSQRGLGGSNGRKKRRRVDEGYGEDEEDSQSSQQLRQEIKKLKRELAEKDERLKRLEEQMALLASSQRLGRV
ncbi:uncharacterized protein KY384_008176 [Bacidia gigantensis]|uniref:uncharacterized protein n=1 Tax=Bacidia gigantensis TaxID=2732470 RepID=UPI001D047E84|nr:uncharacterized protein KY384_008176 [Bacidia gigantensis]KAG8526747.1 hypothetical protein KY384_008176 [Bacidia gigantensis]